MSVETTRDMLMWATIINFGILLLWFVMFMAARDWMRTFHGRWFRISEEGFDTIHYAGMAAFKLGIFLLNLVPWIALMIAT